MIQFRFKLVVQRHPEGPPSIAVYLESARRRRRVRRPRPRSRPQARRAGRTIGFEARAILETLNECGCSFSRLSDDLDWIPRPILSFRLSQLRGRGMVSCGNDQGIPVYTLTNEGREAVGDADAREP